MDRIMSVLADVGGVKEGGGDSFSDRLSCKHTTFLLIVFATIITTKLIVDNPVSCWTPAHFTESHISYTNRICWVTNNYYLSSNDTNIIDKNKKFISYYQWVSLFFVAQAIFFYIPRAVWLGLSTTCGISVSSITYAGMQCQKCKNPEEKQKAICFMVTYLGRYLFQINRQQILGMHRRQNILRRMIYGNHLSIIYLFIKFLYSINAFFQLILINYFISTKMQIYAWTILTTLLAGDPWISADIFPTVTYCDFKIRVLGSIQSHTVKCTLPINFFTEKICIFIWFWIIIVGLTATYSLFSWAYRIIPSTRHKYYVKKRLIAIGHIGKSNVNDIDEFVKDYLKRDGILMIKIISKNASDIIASELVAGLWKHYLSKKVRIKRFSIYDLQAVTNEKNESVPELHNISPVNRQSNNLLDTKSI
ncbi:hypothetical protein A3Q56_04396 [Intoshia linei]|uniref:Innexin n=1 Tax=Intoshia linei TaxID=1819745 RepID=A0A177B0T5_9BILA|nr:hypothetical protein A3Q56_04396 [Intoshia linei]